jgi:putative membrane protein insertion efficiency factor
VSDPNQRRRDNRRRRRQQDDGGDGDLPDLGCVADAVKPCRHCGKPFSACDGGCDLFHLSLLRVFLLSTPVSAPRARVSVPGRVGVAAIRGYQRWLSHRLPTCCPHTPTCSHYGAVVVGRYGLLQGARLAAGRIARCTGDVPRGTPDPPP